MLQMFKCILIIHSREKIWFILVFLDLSKWSMIQRKYNVFWYFTMHWDHWYQMFQMYPNDPWYRGYVMYFGILRCIGIIDIKCFKCIQMNHGREEMKPFELFYIALNWDFIGWFVWAKWHISAISVITLHLP